MSDSIIIQILTIVFTAGSVYGVIRADLKALHASIGERAKDIDRVESSCDKAHERLDHHIYQFHK